MVRWANICVKLYLTSKPTGVNGQSSSVMNVTWKKLIRNPLLGEIESQFICNVIMKLIFRFRFYKTNLIQNIPLTEDQFVTINFNDPIEKVATSYEARIREEFKTSPGNIPSFDLLLLGIGPDGHTASLFPGHKLLKVDDRLIASITDAPKFPPKRITMTFLLINNARYSIFAVPGSGKADIIKTIFSPNRKDLPAGRVKALEKVYWLLDEKSSVHIKNL